MTENGGSYKWDADSTTLVDSIRTLELADKNGSGNANQKRKDYLNWDDYFMSVAFLSAMRSKDPCSQNLRFVNQNIIVSLFHHNGKAAIVVSSKRGSDPSDEQGACIVNSDKKIVGIGYNGMPYGCSDDIFPWGKDSEDTCERKYMYVCHAEMNAILNRIVGELKSCIIYVALFPCNECAKLIIQSGIKEVVYSSNKNWNTPACIASRRMFDASDIKCRQYTPTSSKIVIDFSSIDWNKKLENEADETSTLDKIPKAQERL